MTQPLHLSRFCFWWCWERVSRQHEAETSGSAQRPESVRQKAQSGYGCGKPDDLQQAWHGRQVSLPEGVGDFYSWNIRWFWFFDPYVLLWHLPQSIQDLSSCPFPGLYCSFHVTAPLCGSLRASKVNSAYWLANHPSRKQRGHTELTRKVLRINEPIAALTYPAKETQIVSKTPMPLSQRWNAPPCFLGLHPRIWTFKSQSQAARSSVTKDDVNLFLAGRK